MYHINIRIGVIAMSEIDLESEARKAYADYLLREKNIFEGDIFQGTMQQKEIYSEFLRKLDNAIPPNYRDALNLEFSFNKGLIARFFLGSREYFLIEDPETWEDAEHGLTEPRWRIFNPNYCWPCSVLSSELVPTILVIYGKLLQNINNIPIGGDRHDKSN
jgi:hypothetical protein